MADTALGIVGGVVGGILTAVVLLVLEPRIRRWRSWSPNGRPPGLHVTIETDPNAVVPQSEFDAPGDYFATTFYFATEMPATPPPSGTEWWSWAHAAGGLDADVSAVLITLQNTEDTAVIIDAPRVAITKYSPAAQGVITTPEGLGGGGVAPRIFLVHLSVCETSDDGFVTTRPVTSVTYEDQRPAAFTLGKNETERLLIVARASEGRFDWTAEIPAVVDGRRVVFPIDDHGHPFTVVGSQGLRTWMDADGSWRDITDGYGDTAL